MSGVYLSFQKKKGAWLIVQWITVDDSSDMIQLLHCNVIQCDSEW